MDTVNNTTNVMSGVYDPCIELCGRVRQGMRNQQYQELSTGQVGQILDQDNKYLKSKLKSVNLEINKITLKLTNISEENEKLLNTSIGEYDNIKDLVKKELINLNKRKTYKIITKNKLNKQILEKEKDINTYEKLLEYLWNTLDIPSGNIIGLNLINFKEFTILDINLIKEYIEIYDRNNFNVTYYLIYKDIRKNYDKDLIKKSIENWMEFKNCSGGIEGRYILSVMNSSAGIKGWAY